MGAALAACSGEPTAGCPDCPVPAADASLDIAEVGVDRGVREDVVVDGGGVTIFDAGRGAVVETTPDTAAPSEDVSVDVTADADNEAAIDAGADAAIDAEASADTGGENEDAGADDAASDGDAEMEVG